MFVFATKSADIRVGITPSPYPKNVGNGQPPPLTCWLLTFLMDSS